MAQAKAMEYMEAHSIPQLLENLTAQLVYHQPSDPRKFLAAEIRKLMEARDGKTDAAGLIGADELKAIFGVFDMARTGTISLDAYTQAMLTAGVAPALVNNKPQGYLMDQIKLDTFVSEGLLALAKVNATFAASS